MYFWLIQVICKKKKKNSLLEYYPPVYTHDFSFLEALGLFIFLHLFFSVSTVALISQNRFTFRSLSICFTPPVMRSPTKLTLLKKAKQGTVKNSYFQVDVNKQTNKKLESPSKVLECLLSSREQCGLKNYVYFTISTLQAMCGI